VNVLVKYYCANLCTGVSFSVALPLIFTF
jgi:hypothetical protein